MKEFISHFSAARAWGIPYIDDVLGEKRKNTSQNLIDITANQTGATDNLTGIASNLTDVTANWTDGTSNLTDVTNNRTGVTSNLTDVTTSRQKRNYYQDGCNVHSTDLELPKGAIVRLRGDRIASPELVFLELANHLDLHHLILLGLMMCSHKSGPLSGNKNSITTKKKLDAFIRKTSGHNGHFKAQRALKFIKDGAASIMEAIAFMVLTLPHIYGGYGLEGATFNHEILLDEKTQNLLNQKRCFVDIYFEKSKLAVEYDSFAHHKTPQSQSKDLIRATALELLGTEMKRYGTYQLYNEKACKEFASNIAKCLGKRVRIRTSKFKPMHKKLRELLPTRLKATPPYNAY